MVKIDWSISDKRTVDVDELMRFIARQKLDREFETLIGSFRDAIVGHSLPTGAGLQIVKLLERERAQMKRAGVETLSEWFERRG